MKAGGLDKDPKFCMWKHLVTVVWCVTRHLRIEERLVSTCGQKISLKNYYMYSIITLYKLIECIIVFRADTIVVSAFFVLGKEVCRKGTGEN